MARHLFFVGKGVKINQNAIYFKPWYIRGGPSGISVIENGRFNKTSPLLQGENNTSGAKLTFQILSCMGNGCSARRISIQ